MRPLVTFSCLFSLCLASIVPLDETNQGNKARVAYNLVKEVRCPLKIKILSLKTVLSSIAIDKWRLR